MLVFKLKGPEFEPCCGHSSSSITMCIEMFYIFKVIASNQLVEIPAVICQKAGRFCPWLTHRHKATLITFAPLICFYHIYICSIGFIITKLWYVSNFSIFHQTSLVPVDYKTNLNVKQVDNNTQDVFLLLFMYTIT